MDNTDYESVRRDAEEGARRFAAAIAGAIEGFVEALEDDDLTQGAQESVQEAGKVVRAATEEGAAQADTPEMRMGGRGLKRAGVATADAASSAADAVKATAQDVSYGVKEKIDDVKDAAHNFKEEVKVRADAVGETGRRARAAPRKVGRELKGAARAWWNGLTTSLAMWLLIGVVAITGWIILHIALVAGLNKLLFDPAGTWITFGIDIVIAGIAYAVARSRRAAAQAETRRRMQRSREEIRYVGRPVREAFAGRGRAGF